MAEKISLKINDNLATNLEIPEKIPEFDLDLSRQPDAAPHDSEADANLFFDEDLKKALNKIPDKMAFKIGEVAELLGIKTYVLRYWETEFEALKPKKSSHNQRMYNRKDVENAFFIKKLLYKDRFSIEGARKAMKKLKTEVKKEKVIQEASELYTETLTDIKTLLRNIQTLKTRFE